MRVKDMTQGPAMRLILSTALTLMVGNMFQQMYIIVDASVVGRGLGLKALAALGSADWFTWLFFSVVIGFAQGFSIPVAHAFGAKDYDELRKNVGNAVSLGLLTAVAITAIALLSVTPVLNAMGAPDEVRPIAAAYLRVLFSGIPILMAYNLLSDMLRALGDSRSPLLAMVLSSLINIFLDCLFVFGFGWGVESAAAATVIAQASSFVFCLFRIKSVEFMRMSREDFMPVRARSLRLMRLGAPISAQNAVIAIGGMIVQTVVNGMGVSFIAGYTATNKIYGLLEIAAVSYGYAMTTYAGQNLGAKRLDRVRDGVRAGLKSGIITALCIALIMLLFGKSILSLFIEASETNALDIAAEFLTIMAWCLPILYVLYIYRSALQGMGNAVMPMVSGIAEFVMRTGSALLLPGLIGYTGLFWAEVLAWSGADVILIPSYYRVYRRASREMVSMRSISGMRFNKAM